MLRRKVVDFIIVIVSREIEKKIFAITNSEEKSVAKRKTYTYEYERVSPPRVNIIHTHSIYLLHYKLLQNYSSSDDFFLFRARATFFNALINAVFVVFETLFALRRKRDFNVESFAVRSNAVVNALIGFEAAD